MSAVYPILGYDSLTLTKAIVSSIFIQNISLVSFETIRDSP